MTFWWRSQRGVKAVVASGAAVLMVSFGLVGGAEAAALSCGSVISKSITLTNDVGPCPGAGLVIVASNITVNLNGYTISGDPTARSGDDQVGVRLVQVRGVTLQNGTVEGFDAGVAVMGGLGNTIRRITARDNVNYRIVTGVNSQPEDITPDVGPYCDFGDGITLSGSSRNRLVDNVVTGNGPFAGISLVSNSNANVVANNRVDDNDVLNETPSGEGTTCGSTANGPIDNPPPSDWCCARHGRHSQGVGVRVEGPGAQRNLVEGNQIRRNGLAGVLISGFHIEMGRNNGSNVVRGNQISDTGLRVHDSTGDGTEAYRSSGIQLHHSGPPFIHVSYGNVVENNDSSRNFASGIEITGPEPGSGVLGDHGNIIVGNVVNQNLLDGIHLAEGTVKTKVIGNRGLRNGLDSELVAQISDGDVFANYDGVDGGDYNPACGSNQWLRNRFGTVNQPCVALAGTGSVVGSGQSSSAAAGTGSAGGAGQSSSAPGVSGRSFHLGRRVLL